MPPCQEIRPDYRVTKQLFPLIIPKPIGSTYGVFTYIRWMYTWILWEIGFLKRWHWRVEDSSFRFTLPGMSEASTIACTDTQGRVFDGVLRERSGRAWGSRNLGLLSFKRDCTSTITYFILWHRFNDLCSRLFEPVISNYGKADEHTLVIVGWHWVFHPGFGEQRL